MGRAGKGVEMNGILHVQICMLAQKKYEAAVEKYGIEFADAVVVQELQLFADSLKCFDKYVDYDGYAELIEGQS
jgi:hypothetical protein